MRAARRLLPVRWTWRASHTDPLPVGWEVEDQVSVMGRLPFVPLALACIVGAGLLYALLGAGDDRVEDPGQALEAEPDEVTRRPGLAVSGTRPRPLRVEPPKVSPEEQAQQERLAALWERAVALHRMRRSTQALALLQPVLGPEKAFFEDAARAKLLSSIRTAARKVLAVEAADERLRKLVDELRRWGNLRPSDDPDVLEQQLRHAAEVIAQLKAKKDRERLLTHLERFLVGRPAGWSRAERRGPPRGRGRLDVDGLLAEVQRREEGRDEPTVPLPIAEPEKVEERRMEQLELLRRRGALTLLDSLHAGLAFLAVHQAPDGSFSAEAASTRFIEAHAEDERDITQYRQQFSKSYDRFLVATTALALMAFLDFRDQDGRGLFEPTIARALAWLRKQQHEDGLFPKAGRAYYSDAIALMALAQAAQATGDEGLKEQVERGLTALYTVRGPQGGYRYRAKQAGDLSAAGWVAQAVEYATLAGIAVPDGMRADLEGFLRLVWLGGERFSYLSHGGKVTQGRPRSSLYPVGMLMGRILWDMDRLTLKDRRAWSVWLTKGVGRRAPYLYTLYYGVRMDVWLHAKLTTKWHTWLVELSQKQIRLGPLAGGFPREAGRYMRSGGALLTTAFALLTMEHALFLR